MPRRAAAFQQLHTLLFFTLSILWIWIVTQQNSNQLLTLRTKSCDGVLPHLPDEVRRLYHGCRADAKLKAKWLAKKWRYKPSIPSVIMGNGCLYSQAETQKPCDEGFTTWGHRFASPSTLWSLLTRRRWGRRMRYLYAIPITLSLGPGQLCCENDIFVLLQRLQRHPASAP